MQLHGKPKKLKLKEEFGALPMNWNQFTVYSDQPTCQPIPVSLGDCKPAPTPCAIDTSYERWLDYKAGQQKQGNNPMAYDTKNTFTSATIVNAQSDESRQRDYLLSEFADKFSRSYADPQYEKLNEKFNLSAPKFPKSSQALLDAFSAGKFTVDQVKVDKNTKLFAIETDGPEYDDDDGYIGERFYGITFTDLPVADRKGYADAVVAYEKAKVDTKRAIIVKSPADGLQALIDLENWTPNAPTYTTTITA